jgi:BarA-like signal transduction histidine kinase
MIVSLWKAMYNQVSLPAKAMFLHSILRSSQPTHDALFPYTSIRLMPLSITHFCHLPNVLPCAASGSKQL